MATADSAFEAELEQLREDIAALELRRDTLRDERDKFYDLYEWAPDLCASVDPRTASIIEYNARVAQELGYDRTELLGRSILTLFHPRDHAQLSDRIAHVAGGGELRDLELHCLRKDGSFFFVSLNVAVQRDEKGHVISSHGVARDITAQKEVEDALTLSQARLRGLTETLSLAPWQIISDLGREPVTPHSTDTLGQYHATYVGPQFEQLLGYPTSRWHEPGFWLSIIHPDDRAATLARAAARDDHANSYRDEVRLIAADGRAIPTLVLTSATPIDGRLVISGVIVDLTEVKTAEAAQQSFMRELDHRVKNTFATVQAVMNHTLATSDGIEQFIQTFRGRIAALGLVHNTMARSDWSAVNLSELIGSSLAPFGGPPRVQTHGDAIAVPFNVGRNLGMVLHELATNASKYGSLSTPAGTVSVRWRSEEQCRGSTLFLDWTEKDGPPVHQATRRGYGLRLIEDLIPYELSGTAHVHFAESGLQCGIEIPLDESTAAPPGAPADGP